MQLKDLKKYNYSLPKTLIRKQGLEPRDSARLFVYDTENNAIYHDFFYNLAEYLPRNSLMILNETRVVPARLWLKKETGGKIEVFVLANEWEEDSVNIPILVDRKVLIGNRLFFSDGSFFEILRQEEGKFFARLESKETLNQLLDFFGETPIPHYLEDTIKENELKLRQRYQTIFAKTGSSVAAPTASLHFTDRVFNLLEKKEIHIAKVTLDVGQGTFAPLREENFKTQSLHSERIHVSLETVNKLNEAKKNDHKITAVGTTALRTLESISSKGNIFSAYSGETDIFIFPPHAFHSADILITNFHLPKTSLMLLVDAFLQHKKAKRGIVSLYEEAIQKEYAFYSFGDSMLIL